MYQTPTLFDCFLEPSQIHRTSPHLYCIQPLSHAIPKAKTFEAGDIIIAIDGHPLLALQESEPFGCLQESVVDW